MFVFKSSSTGHFYKGSYPVLASGEGLVSYIVRTKTFSHLDTLVVYFLISIYYFCMSIVFSTSFFFFQNEFFKTFIFIRISIIALS